MARARITEAEAPAFHAEPVPGTWEVQPTKPMTTQRDLSLSCSPGVAISSLGIAADPEAAYDDTNKGDLVAVITNGTAVLGPGNLGALASTPVTAGRAVLFRRFADVSAIDLALDTGDAVVAAVGPLVPSFGGVDIEDIKAPERIVLDGVGAAGIGLLEARGPSAADCVACDTEGVLSQGGAEGLDHWKSGHATRTDHGTLAEAMSGADVLLGVPAKGATTAAMAASMARDPVIFDMANPGPETTPKEAHAVRPGTIVATGRSDDPDQVNDVLDFRHLIRGALDIPARAIDDAMTIACAEPLAALAPEEVPDDVAMAHEAKLSFGRNCIIPTPFDPRPIRRIPVAVAAGMRSGVARRGIPDMEAHGLSLRSRMDPTSAVLRGLHARARSARETIAVAEGDDPRVLRAAVDHQRSGLARAIVAGREADVRETLSLEGVADATGEIGIAHAAVTPHVGACKVVLHACLRRRGFDAHDIHRLATLDRRAFAALMLAYGHADAVVTGTRRKPAHGMDLIGHVLDAGPRDGAVGVTVVLHKGRIVLAARALAHERPEEADLAFIARRAAAVARDFGLTPRVAILSVSTFNHPASERATRTQGAPRILDAQGRDFEYEGDLTVDVALDPRAAEAYPFPRPTGPVDVLVVPARHSAAISARLLQEMAGATVSGPILAGIGRPIQLCSTVSITNDVLDMAAMAAAQVERAADGRCEGGRMQGVAAMGDVGP